MNITLTSGKNISIKPGTSILESLKLAGIYLTSSCGGKGTCGKCKIIIKSGKAEFKSRIKLSKDEIGKGYAIACQSYPTENVVIDIPKEYTKGICPDC
jgi:uncharacterized 2Fe-2S/4Fe-4S cluster protein (DUF4445 family)